MGKVFVVSLHRNATQSADLFLREAGLKTCHWPSTVNSVHYEGQIAGIETQPAAVAALLRPVFDEFEACSDVPVPALYQELDRLYPGARFIAIRRDPFDWLRSVRRHCAARRFDPYERVQYWRYCKGQPPAMDALSDDELGCMYLQHYQELAAHFRGRPDLLIADLADPRLGEKLSAFLGMPVREFPYMDDHRGG